MGDFLHKNANTPLVQEFAAGGVPCRISTNSPSILQAASENFCIAHAPAQPEFSMRFWVDPSINASQPWPKPHVRGLDHLVYAGFDEGSFAVVDLRLRRIVGRFSQAMAGDISHWHKVVFPMLISVIGASVGIAELHCACVARENKGILLAGPTHSGKSTLALALSSLGCGFVSDDRTCCSLRDGELRAWSLLTDLKLRDEATGWFPGLRDACEAGDGRDSWRLSPELLPTIQRVRDCVPRLLLFLEPQPSAGFRLTRISLDEAAARLSRDLMAESAEAAKLQDRVIARLAELPSRILQYSDDPWSVARQAISCFHDLGSGDEAQRRKPDFQLESNSTAARQGRPSRQSTANLQRPDPLTRFKPTHHCATLAVMGRPVTLETDSPTLLRRVGNLFSIYPPAPADPPQFRWRLILKPPSPSGAGGFRRAAFSDRGLRFTQVGRRSFHAVDLESRTAVASVAEELMDDEPRFTVSFMDSLLCMSASSLGLVSFFANCVARDGIGVLILGPPGSGKTTASYLAARTGAHLHADDGVFLEMHKGALRSWGGFWPVAFRKDAVDFLPEIERLARQFTYGDLVYYHLDEGSFQSLRANPVRPVCSLFLRRRALASTSISDVPYDELRQRLTQSLLFEEDEQFHAQQEAVLDAVASLPAYELAYESDPAAATAVIHQLLYRHAEEEPRGAPVPAPSLSTHSRIEQQFPQPDHRHG